MEGNIVFNLGLWDGVFDVNAVDKLSLSSYSYTVQHLKKQNTIIPPGTLASLCSMNMILKREVIPALYQFPMNESVIPNWTIDRYGDIWGGFVCKKLIDIRGDNLSIGEPRIMHHKNDTQAGILRNITQEHYAHIVNLQFCDLLDAACLNIPPDNYLNMYKNLVDNLYTLRDQWPDEMSAYLVPTLKKMKQWTKILDK